MNDRQWDDYIRRQPGTFYGEAGRRNDEAFRAALDQPTRRRVQSSGGLDKAGAIFAILGFVAGFGYVYSQPNPDGGVAFVMGIIGALVGGKFYPLVIMVVVVGGVMWFFS